MATELARMAVLGAIAQADLEIESEHREQRRREADAAAVQVPIALIDSLLSDLELINIAECTRVPDSIQPSLCWLLDNCPAECPDLSVSVSPVHLMDMLFDLQESLFALKGGDFRRRLQLEDEHRSYSGGFDQEKDGLSPKRRSSVTRPHI
jgi:hypothetical protein